MPKDDGLQTLQHLLRNLNNFPRLRKNALVESLRLRCNVNGNLLHARVRGAVVRALDAIVHQHAIEHGAERAKRWQTIIQRCDLNDEPHTVVANDLGLAHARFYVERRAAQQALAATLIQELYAQSDVPLTIPSAAELRIDLAISERERGHFQDAVQILEGVVSSTADRAQHLAALTELVETYWMLGLQDRFPRLIEEARALCYSPPSTDPALETEMQMIEAVVFCVQGDVKGGIEALERVRRRLLETGGAPNHRGSLLMLRVLLELAMLDLVSGQAIGAESRLAQAENVFERSPSSLPELRSRYLCLRAEAALFRGDLKRAVQTSSEGFPIARHNGLVVGMVRASHLLGTIFLEGRQLEPARRHAENAVMLGELLPNPEERVNISILLARVERLSGHADRALALAQKAQQQYSPADPRSWMVGLSVAEALESAGRSHEALRLLDESAEGFTRQGMHRCVGASEGIRARLCLNLNRIKEARVAIDNALQILERHGSLYGLGNAYELSARATGNRTHNKRSREIRAQLTLD